VWDEALAGHAVAGSAGEALSNAGAGAGHGAELLTVTVLDDSAAALEGATVYAHNAVGALVGIGLIVLRRHDRAAPLPYGPYLAVAGAIALFAGPALVRLYLPGS